MTKNNSDTESCLKGKLQKKRINKDFLIFILLTLLVFLFSWCFITYILFAGISLLLFIIFSIWMLCGAPSPLINSKE